MVVPQYRLFGLRVVVRQGDDAPAVRGYVVSGFGVLVV